MKGPATMNPHVKYESPDTYQSEVMINVKVFKLKVKLKGQRVEVMVPNERSCHKEPACEI